MYSCLKQPKVDVERSAGQQLLEEKALSDQLVRSSSLDLKDQVKDVKNHTMLQQSNLNSQIKEEFGDSRSRDDQNLSCFFCGSEFATGGRLTKHISGHTGEKLLTCVICKKTFTLESELDSHTCPGESSQHHQSQTEDEIPASKQFSCSQCGEGFSRSEDLNLHLKLHTRGNLFSCSVCNACCSDKDSLIQHMRIHTRQTQFTCHVCGKDFAWRRHLTKHMEVHKKRKKVFRCRACGAEFCTYYLLSKHKVVHQSSEIPHSQTEENREENEQMETAADGEDFGRPEPTKNLNTDTQTQQETNEETSLSMKTEDVLWKQTSVRHNEVCQSDTKTDLQPFTLKEDLIQHTAFDRDIQKEVKQEDPEPPQIKEEEEEAEISKFTVSPVPLKTEEDEEKPQSLQLHHSQSEENRDFLGDETEKTSSFSDPDTDDSNCWKPKREPQSGSNSESDSGRNPSSCSDNKATESLQPESDDSVDSDFFKDYKKPQSDLNSLRQEATEKGAKYVTDLKPYSCTQCSKVFRYSSYLKIHMKQHTERYFCSVCGHKSTSSSNLKVHLRTHTGEKPFSCSICGKKYTNKASMLSHMSVHDAERKYSCDECKKSFAWYTELKYHQCVGESSHEQTYEEDSNINLKRHILYS
ncbi:oocyte zinc finger protein XlCOF8.4-like [Kryptolebias marmoratus]|uniref:oocyte zinc finger protein XlCOF8.4-like n=1 Tax=Kryptolebias marmoratus TaxID=37003 RepID=UPI0007F8AB3A|nr:oocyte zinc finger protein XlCOF8.4-like [Kryptolebias marmoratus]XP_037831553.1 oocyte zinc finger protein XlCOF8.4-like [Kryptolebias marmoratus]